MNEDVEIKQEFQVKNYNNLKLLCVYMNHSNVLKEDNDEGDSELIFNFDDVLEHVIMQPDKYDGIIINPGENQSIILVPFIVNNYLPERILTNDKRMINLLDKLADNEKKYVGEESIKYISEIYFNDKNPKELTKKYNRSPGKIGDALIKGYAKLKDIIKCNY